MNELESYLDCTLDINDHGGNCCGRRHIAELGYVGPRVEIVQRIQNLMSDGWEAWDDELDCEVQRNDSEMGIEITLTSEQANTKPSDFIHSWPIKAIEIQPNDPYKDKTWDEVLTTVLGFRKVFSFVNPNTDNIVHVYFYSDNEV